MGRPLDDLKSVTERLLIGVDPGKSTGICILGYDTKEIRAIFLMDFWKSYYFFKDAALNFVPISQIYIEQPSLVKSLYARHAARLEETKSKIVTRDKIVWDAGGNAREGILLRDGLRELGYVVFDCKPVGRKKWNSEQFQQVTGYADHSNQHVRDAAFLVYDKPWQDNLQI